MSYVVIACRSVVLIPLIVTKSSLGMGVNDGIRTLIRFGNTAVGLLAHFADSFWLTDQTVYLWHLGEFYCDLSWHSLHIKPVVNWFVLLHCWSHVLAIITNRKVLYQYCYLSIIIATLFSLQIVWALPDHHQHLDSTHSLMSQLRRWVSYILNVLD